MFELSFVFSINTNYPSRDDDAIQGVCGGFDQTRPDQTPRECAANPDTREKAIHWLKNMELHNMKTEQVFDTTWMWEELNLTDYR